MIAELEKRLTDPEGPFAPERVLRGDRDELLPREACRALYDAGLHLACVPRRYGGTLDDYFRTVQGIRLVARRDLSVAVAHGQIMLGTAPIWVAGTDDQATRVAAEIAAGAVISFGLTEREHGSDVLANDAHAVRADGGWRLSGEKWPINYATHGDLICVFARTESEPGPRAFSLFLVDKRELPHSQIRYLPKTHTFGLRGADISGVEFTEALLPEHALVGRPGDGAAIALKSLQMTRVGCAGLSLGAADHAVRLAVAATGTADHERRLLGRAVAGVLTAEAVAALGARCFHTLPGEMSVVSAVVKSFVPGVADEVVRLAGALLGSDAVRDASSAYAKLERDHRIVEIFDGSTYVNRTVLINHFPMLSRAWRRGTGDESAVRLAARLDAPVPPFDARRLGLLATAGASVVTTVREHPVLSQLAEELHRDLASWRPAMRDVPPEGFELARRYEQLFAAAACVHVHRANGLSDGWLEATMAYLFAPADADAVYLRLADEVLAGAVPGPDSIDPTGWGL
ncbi:acyl-CoA dehydrogenase family protein [Nocardia puris]|uniref:acyl-CoA dehydrogenase family protein n=1 Tax=Nocardia puris TaxID=208602 RepID=UPI001894C060|nr:acyl-CoA dehydrogenase family protein [Nocardia puris]MBF6462513.1 acyl-CoA dehydrogenase family protein [Nocardia puris]